MKTIYTPKGEEIYVDDEDYEYLNQWPWWISSRNHAQGYVDKVQMYMANYFLPPKDGFIVDHKDRNPRNNCKDNLRYATYSQNSANATKQQNTTSKYKGVSWYSKSGKWTMKYYENKRQIHGGYFECEHEAAERYNEEMFRIHGEYANLNIIERE